MEWVIGLAILAFMIVLAVGALTGRVQARSCCAATDPRRDLRMAAAYDDVSPAPVERRSGH